VDLSYDKLYKLILEGEPALFYSLMETEEDEKNYDFSVFASDTSGNELLMLSPILRNITSYDDLPPMIVEGTSVTKITPGNVSITWDRPVLDLDKSIIEGLKGFHVYYSSVLTNDATGLTPIKTKEVQPSHADGDLEFRYNIDISVPGDGHIAVIGFDKNNNEQKEGVLFVQY
jgi:hypothetical protein